MAVFGLRAGLLREILTMAVETLRGNKLRSAPGARKSWFSSSPKPRC